jgi:hypothetical protein
MHKSLVAAMVATDLLKVFPISIYPKLFVDVSPFIIATVSACSTFLAAGGLISRYFLNAVNAFV